jgi:hypothetical protein
MDVRDAKEADAERMGEIAESPPAVMRNLVHDRTVRVATDPDEEDQLVGLVSFDAQGDSDHVTQLAGSRAACARLLEEPVRFARSEGMAVELLVPETDEAVRHAVEEAGFSDAGSGPEFRGEATTRYRLDPGAVEQ